jgi:hypothetical protein
VSALCIDWEELGFALTWRADEGRNFLHRETGEVIAWTGADDPEELLIVIDPLPSSAEYGWMEEFGDDHRRRLASAARRGLAGRGPFRRFKDVLAGHPAEREHWFAFHGERVREVAREWLEDDGVRA